MQRLKQLIMERKISELYVSEATAKWIEALKVTYTLFEKVSEAANEEEEETMCEGYADSVRKNFDEVFQGVDKFIRLKLTGRIDDTLANEEWKEGLII